MSLNEYTQQAIAEIENYDSIIEQPEDIILANRQGIKVVYEGNDGKKRMEVWMIKNKNIYIITYTAEEDKYNKFLEKAEKIISSFEIISTDERR